MPAETGPMKGGWTAETPVVLAALARVRRETNHALDRVQVGDDIPESFWLAVADIPRTGG